MAFLIPDNLRSRKDVPEGVRRVASSLQMGLDESATLWFEPPFDPSKQKPHFVLLLPDRGIIVLELLEIKAGGSLLGVFRRNIRILRDGQESEVENPLHRAQRFAEVLRARIAAEPRLNGHSIPVAAGAIFHVVARAEAEPKGLTSIVAPEACLFREEIEAGLSGSGEALLQRSFAKMLGGNYQERLTGGLEKVLRGIIQPEVVIDRAATKENNQLVIFRAPSDQGEILRVMDRHQEAMAKSLGDGHRIIRGVAGSGKTLVLVFRARLLSQLFPTDKILVTCYTRSLAGQLRSVLADRPNVAVRHLDGLMADVIKEAGLKHPGYEDSTGDLVAKTALSALSAASSRRYRAVLLDEGQDFGSTALQFALGLLQGGSEDFILVADAAQNIFRRRFSWKSVGIQAQGRTRILRQNYRNTREILDTAYRFLIAGGETQVDGDPGEDDENAVIPPEAALRQGPAPALRVCTSEEAESESIVWRLKTWLQRGQSPRSLAVLYASGDGQPFRLIQRLRKEGIDTFWLSDPQDKYAKDRISETRSPVILTTIHSAKGLEFPKVILMGLPSEKEATSDYRKLAYVGMTRATDELEAVLPANHPFISDFTVAFQGRVA